MECTSCEDGGRNNAQQSRRNVSENQRATNHPPLPRRFGADTRGRVEGLGLLNLPAEPQVNNSPHDPNSLLPVTHLRLFLEEFHIIFRQEYLCPVADCLPCWNEFQGGNENACLSTLSAFECNFDI